MLVVLVISLLVHAFVAAFFVLSSVHGPEVFATIGPAYFIISAAVTITGYIKLRSVTDSRRMARYVLLCAAPLGAAMLFYFAAWSY